VNGHGPRVVLSLALAAALLGYVLPRVAGTTMHDVGAALDLVTPAETVLLTVLWATGLFVYSFVLTAALPGLSRQRALNLNLTGSAVANVLPFGGAAGMSLNYLMMRSWGFSTSGFSAYTLITNVWSVLLKLALPAVALTALLVSGEHVTESVRWTGLGAAAALGLVVLVLVAALATPAAAVRAAGVVAPLVARASRLVRRPVEREVVAGVLLEFRDRVAGLVGERWPQLSLGTIGYGLLQALLLWACLEAVGAQLSPVVVLAAYAVDRVMSMVFLTPGGTGFAEAGTAAALVALGGAPAAMAAGVLLYRGFTFALEIPVGGVWLGGWLVARRRRNAADVRRAAAMPTELLESDVR
jgi:putative heme transporter